MNPLLPDDDDEIQFAAETESTPPITSWKILIVDDEAAVHSITRLALRDVTFAGRSLTFISAYSAQEARHLIQIHPDTAIIFLDVVMEHESAGLELVHYIREDLNNPLVRIILRTGQPGQAPEEIVAVNYGIDDYKTKTELTAQKLAIAVITALRAFATLMHLLADSRHLEAEIIQHKQREIALRVSEMSAIDKAQQLEQSLQSLRQMQQQWGDRPTPTDANAPRPNPLSQQVTATQELINLPTATFQTVSTVTRLARMVLRLTDEHAARLGLSQTKLAVMIYLSSEVDLGASPSDLAKHCGVSRAAMTGLLDSLEQDEYVARDNHPSDRRALMIKLTAKGQQFLDGIAPQEHDQMSALLGALSATERQKLIELALKLTQMFAV